MRLIILSTNEYFMSFPVLEQPIRQTCNKKMTVSPFFDVSGFYKFRISSLGEKISNAIEYSDGQNLKMRALFRGKDVHLIQDKF